MAEYKTITKKELTELLDKYPEDEEFNIIQTQLGMTIIPLGGRIANKVDILEIANAAKTMIYSENKFMSQVDMHSVRQDIFNIERNGALNALSGKAASGLLSPCVSRSIKHSGKTILSKTPRGMPTYRFTIATSGEPTAPAASCSPLPERLSYITTAS